MAGQSTVKTLGSNQTATTTMSSLLVAATSLTLESMQQLNKTSSALGGHEPDRGGGWPHGSDPCKQAHKYQNNAFAGNNNNSTQFNFNLEADQDELYVKMSTFWYCCLAFVTAIGLFVSLISNMIIIYLFTGTPSFRRNPSNIIAVNLSLSDLLYCTQWPSVIYCSLSQSTWMLEIDFVCKTFGFITVTTASASVLTVLAMSVERAIVIKYSIYAKSRYTIRIAWSIVVLIWFVSISSSLPPLFDKFNRFTLDPSKTSCTLDYLSGKTHFKLYMLLIYIIYWILPATIITICYIFIIITFKRSSKQIAAVGAAPPPSLASWSSNSAAAAAAGADQVEVNPSDGGRFWSGVRFGPGLRVHSRDSIRWPNMWPASLRRSSTTRLAKGRADGRKSAAKMTATKSSDNLFGFHTASRNKLVQQTIGGQLGPSTAHVATTGPEGVCRQLDSVSSSECNVSTSNLEPSRAGWGMEPERIDDASKCLSTRPSGPPNSSFQVTLNHCRFGRQQTRQPETSDENSPTTLGAASSVLGSRPKISTTCGSKEQSPVSSLKWHSPGWRHSCGGSSNILASNLPDSGSLNGRQVISMNSLRPLSVRHGLDELDIAKLHAIRRCGQLDGSSDEIVAESELTTAGSRQAPGSCRAKLAIISRVMAQLNRASSSGQKLTSATTTTMNLTTNGGGTQNQLNSTNATANDEQQPTPTEATQATCHIGNSSSHSAARASMQIRLAKTSFYLIVLWLISWTPIASLTLINLIVECHLRANALVVFLANTMTKLGPTFDVFIYGISHPKIKRKFIQIIKRLLMLNNQTDDDVEDKSRFSVASNKLSFNSTLHRSQNRSIHRSLALGEDKLQANTGRFHRLRSGVEQVRAARLF